MPTTLPTTRIRRSPWGYTLLELVAAIALVAGTLAPALALIRDGLELSVATDEWSLLANYGVFKLEENLALVAASWTTGAVNGDFASDGNDDIRFSVTRSDLVADGGLPGRLMHVQVTVYVDDDGDNALDADEPQTVYRTKIGRFASYETIAGN